MNDIQFLNWVTPRVGPVNAVNAVQSARINSLVDLLIEKGLISKEELDLKTGTILKQVGDQFMSAPVVSPIQNRPI